ncbi:MAG: TetR/AcrR family transcriptional regulator [bacterium]|nr:TetR/AcrR family transcriptional regulator [bacterium]
MTTKQKISKEALRLFSIRGYEATSVRDIAKAVGIKDSSLYNHYKSKQDIFDTIVNEYKMESANEFEQFCKENDCTRPEILKKSAVAIIAAFLDPCVVQTRKMLTMEMYHNKEAKDVYYKLFYKEPASWCDIVFEQLIEAGVLEQENQEALFYEFYGPLFTLLLETDLLEISKDTVLERAVTQAERFIENHRR